VTTLYADSSALVKLVRNEAESSALRLYLEGADIVSSELVLTEIPRAVHRAAARDPAFPLHRMLDQVATLLETLGLRPIDRALLSRAGAIPEPALRALDAIHVASAIDLDAIDVFVTYDERQAAAARLAGLRTMSPGNSSP
jgi:predicted nucleic acid-binding protein